MSETADPTFAGLDSPLAPIRQDAAAKVGRAAQPEHACTLAASLWSEPECFVRETLTWGLARIGSDALPPIYAALADAESPEVMTLALHVISKIADPSSGPYVLPFVGHEEPLVDLKALWTLGCINYADGLPVIVALLGEQCPKRRNMITAVLAGFKAPAVDLVVPLLCSFSPQVRLHAAEVLTCLPGDMLCAQSSALALAVQTHCKDTEFVEACLTALVECPDSPGATAAFAHARTSCNARIKSIAERLFAEMRHA